MRTQRAAAAVLLALLFGLLPIAGCADGSRNDAILRGIGKLHLVDAPGITLHIKGSGGGNMPGLASQDVFGELMAEPGVKLPPDLATSVAEKIRTYLQQSVCNITGGANGQGIGYTEASGVKNANIQGASIYFDCNRNSGQVDVLVVDRDYRFDKQHVVGQLIVLARAAR